MIQTICDWCSSMEEPAEYYVLVVAGDREKRIDLCLKCLTKLNYAAKKARGLSEDSPFGLD